MSNDAYIFDITDKNFDDLVIQNSHQLPVILLFMGVYSGPCITMERSLSEYAKDFSGQFIFAKVDIDEQPELAKSFDIQNVPTTFVMRDGEIAEAVEGFIENEELGILLKGLGIYRRSDELREQARSVYLLGNVAEAVRLLTEAIQADPGNVRVAMDMTQIMIDLDQLEQATGLFNRLPDSAKSSQMGKALIGQLTFKGLAAKTIGKDALLSVVQNGSEDPQTRFDLALCLVAEHDYSQAMQQLFTILRQTPGFKEGAAKELAVTVTNMLEVNEPQMSQQFRRQLANLQN
ncbi:tetratricopeptide repeat protein [Thiomicrorhabdus heinhorstiae]|uniref:Tetratricopeptide repeat protein n=1 Tax=Thiomicrorhabdus heinhorstiae TaxID=2748010 RepID=A0ABS0BVQ7_9GAMM|nr:tetratricopeptide repeat protein [Thiomicrorhabdus heinhorstiae]MBF6057044.1 tetratricopeptide repeat protein [Thiomicrorhabdus heinhorstiae]